MSHHHLTVRAPAVDPDDNDGSESSLAEVLRFVEDCHRRALGALGTAVVAAYEAGMMLHAYRLQFQHGAWEDAVRQIVREEGLDITLRTCQRYLQVASILSELLLAEFGQDQLRDQKTTRATLLRILRQRELLSINKVLALKKTKPAKKSKATRAQTAATEGDASAEPDEAVYLTPKAILVAVEEFFGQKALESSGLPTTSGQSLDLPVLGFAGDDLAALPQWSGNLFVHPPQDLVVPFIERTISAIETGAADQAIVLVTAEMDAEHASLLQPYVRGFLRKRPTFETPSGEFVVPQTAYMLVHVSRNDDRSQEFAEAFGHLADIYYPHRF